MNVYDAVEDAYLTLNGQYIASLSDARMIVREEAKVENMYSVGKSEQTGIKKHVRNSITGQLTFDKVSSHVYQSELKRMKKPNIIARFEITGLFQERFTNAKQNLTLKGVMVNDMSFLEVGKHLQPGVTLTFKASRIETYE
jgi:hypothetical protein